MTKPFYSLGAFKAALTLTRLLPRRATHSIARLAGRFGYRRNPAARDALRENLGHVTPLAGGELDRLCAKNIRFFSSMMADYFLSAADSQRAGALLDKWSGFENLQAALNLGKGVILVTAHLGNWELGGTLLALRGLPMSIITLEEPTSELSQWRETHRRALGIKTIIVGPGHDFAFVEMIQALRRNEILAMLVDRPYQGTGTAVDFFGGRTEFSTGPALLWQHTGAAVVPAFVLQNERGLYTSFADPALELQRGEDPKADLVSNTQRVAAYFESIIRQHPEQWFNYVPIWNS